MNSSYVSRPVRRRYTLSDALDVAQWLNAMRRVLSVDVYGSIARQGTGHDIDLILTVEINDWQSFQAQLIGSIIDTYRLRASDRLFAALATLGISLDAWHQRVGYNLVDIYLLPVGWRDLLDALQDSLHHSDPDFMRHIAWDARRFDPATRAFAPAVR